MAQIFGALILLGAYFSTALLVLVDSSDLSSLSEIARICNDGGLQIATCQPAAREVAAQGLLAIIMVTVATLGLAWKSLQDSAAAPPTEVIETAPQLTLSLLAVVSAVLIVHNMRHDLIGLAGQHYRLAESSYVSLENLVWPLLLQIILWSQQIRWKFMFAGFLTAIAMISPFRSAIFSILYFGVLIPSGTFFIFRHSLSRRAKLISLASLMMAVILLVSVIVLYQTARRLEGAAYEAGPGQSRVAVIERGLSQRALTPFFQAALVGRLVQAEAPLPDFMASIGQKLHVGYRNLNEYVFNAIYDGYGQTTTLYYGESVANTSIPPIFWQFAAPLALVLTYFLLRPTCDIGALIGVAVWRSAMGGLFDVVTALVLQVTFCLLLTYPHAIRRYLLSGPALWALVSALVAINLALLAIQVQVWQPAWNLRLNSGQIYPEIGKAYVVSLSDKTPLMFLFEIVGDTPNYPQASSLEISEDGQPLGPPHSQHADIRTKGTGQYSHWHDMLYFSSRDGSDPRTNGRQYVLSDNLRLIPQVWIIVAALDIAMIGLFARSRFIFLRRKKFAPVASADTNRGLRH